MLRKIYKIWKIQKDVKRKPNVDWIEYDPEKKTRAYPLIEIISTLPNRYERQWLINKDPAELEDFCQYLNEMADLDEYYEIREEEVDDGL